MTTLGPTASCVPRRVTLLCPEPLRASACCVEDALIARGWRVRLEFGAQARRVLLRPGRPDARELKVLCTAEPLEADVAAQLRLGVDPEGRGDFQIVLFDTPRAVIEAVERMGGAASSRRRRLAPRRGRTYLQQPTLVEQQVHQDRNRRWGIATAVAVAIAAVAGIEAGPRSPGPVDAPIVQRANDPGSEERPRSPTLDEPVLAAVRAEPTTDDGDPALDEPLIVIEDEPQDDRTPASAREDRGAPLEVAPLEPALATTPTGAAVDVRGATVPSVATAAAPADLERLRATYTIDPFASVADPPRQ